MRKSPLLIGGLKSAASFTLAARITRLTSGSMANTRGKDNYAWYAGRSLIGSSFTQNFMGAIL